MVFIGSLLYFVAADWPFFGVLASNRNTFFSEDRFHVGC